MVGGGVFHEKTGCPRAGTPVVCAAEVRAAKSTSTKAMSRSLDFTTGCAELPAMVLSFFIM